MRIWVISASRMREFLVAVLALVLLAMPWSASAVPTGSQSVQEGIPVPILMYHSVRQQINPPNDYIITPGQLENDLKYLSDQGYTTVTIADLIDYVYLDAPLPEKPVMLTFDDGHLSLLSTVLPLLEKYDMKAVAAVVGAYTDTAQIDPDKNPNYAYLSWEDLSTLEASGRIEIQNHSYHLHSQTSRKGALKKQGESAEEYAKTFKNDVRLLAETLQSKCGINATAFIYPYGFIEKGTTQMLKDIGIFASLGCRDGVSTITKDPDCLYQLKRVNRSGVAETWIIMQKIAP